MATIQTLPPPTVKNRFLPVVLPLSASHNPLNPQNTSLTWSSKFLF